MIAKRVLSACGACLLLSGMRDPFQPPPDTCQLAQLRHWQFRGMVQGELTVGIVRDADGRWYRVASGETLPAGWRVISVTADELQVDTGKDCIPAQWRWIREGTLNEKMDSGRHALRAALHLRSDNATGHPDRR